MSIPLTNEEDTFDFDIPTSNKEFQELAENNTRLSRQEQAKKSGRKKKLGEALFTSKSEVHLTPEKVMKCVREFYDGHPDLDPAAESADKPHTGALTAFTVTINGLIQKWFGKVFNNPPYGRGVIQWAKKAKESYLSGDCEHVIFLVAGRIDTKMAQELSCFVECQVNGRLKFLDANGKEQDPAPFPSIIYYMGADVDHFASVFSQIGRIKWPDHLKVRSPGGLVRTLVPLHFELKVEEAYRA